LLTDFGGIFEKLVHLKSPSADIVITLIEKHTHTNIHIYNFRICVFDMIH